VILLTRRPLSSVLQKAHHCAIDGVAMSGDRELNRVGRWCVVSSRRSRSRERTTPPPQPHLTSLDQSLNTRGHRIVLGSGLKQSLQVVAVWHLEGCIEKTIMLYKLLITHCTRKTFPCEVQVQDGHGSQLACLHTLIHSFQWHKILC
jgi:hypothetical protein